MLEEHYHPSVRSFATSLKSNESIININLIEMRESWKGDDRTKINLNIDHFINFLPQNVKNIFINSIITKNYLLKKFKELSEENKNKIKLLNYENIV